MKLKLIEPGKIPFFSKDAAPGWHPMLGLSLLAAITPPEWEISIVDGDAVDNLDYDEDLDLVGVSILSVHAAKGYEVLDAYREKGVKTVAGGCHPTFLPEEAQQHADAVVIGEGEALWPQVLEDAKKGKLKKLYKADRYVDASKIPIPRIDLLDDTEYANVQQLIPTRGCPKGCLICIVPVRHGLAVRKRAVSEVVEELKLIQKLRGKDVLISIPENPTIDREYANQLCPALEPLQADLSIEGYLPQFRDEDYLKMLKKAGCNLIYAQVEGLTDANKAKRLPIYEESVKKTKDAGIDLIVNFMVAFDDQDKSVFFETWDFIDKLNLVAAVEVLTPWPGTPLFRKMKKEKRIITEDWSQYDGCHVVFKPRLMTEDEARWGFEQSIHKVLIKGLEARKF
jgi:radical SAM superfamily enzyme YgiQ (UPF0313 family)